MKNLYQTNKVLIIINILLGFTIYLGLLFLIPLGITQLLTTFIMIYNEKKLTKKISTALTIYCMITTITLIGAYFMYSKFIPSNSVTFVVLVCTSVLLAFLHLYITSLVDKMINNKKGIII